MEEKPDCRTQGCGKNAECIREQAFFVCRCLPGTSGQPNLECTRGEFTPFTYQQTNTKQTHTYSILAVNTLTARLFIY